MLTAAKLECRRGSRTLFRGLDFTIQPGELLHVQGINGSGKTSLLRILAGLSTQESGEVLWNGINIQQMREDYASSMLYLGHQPAVKDDLTASENLFTWSRLSGLEPTLHDRSAALETIGLAKCANLPARVLSQGQKRRLALAGLWFDSRQLWIMDEPFTALDVHASTLLENRLEHHLSEGGMIVLTTHQLPTIQERHRRVLRLA